MMKHVKVEHSLVEVTRIMFQEPPMSIILLGTAFTLQIWFNFVSNQVTLQIYELWSLDVASKNRTFERLLLWVSAKVVEYIMPLLKEPSTVRFSTKEVLSPFVDAASVKVNVEVILLLGNFKLLKMRRNFYFISFSHNDLVLFWELVSLSDQQH